VFSCGVYSTSST